jgi:hypothetical protein
MTVTRGPRKSRWRGWHIETLTSYIFSTVHYVQDIPDAPYQKWTTSICLKEKWSVYTPSYSVTI